MSCGSQSLDKFQTEIAIHSHWPDKTAPLVFVFPRVSVCMNCGKLTVAEEFAIPDEELRKLINPQPRRAELQLALDEGPYKANNSLAVTVTSKRNR